MQNYAGLHIDRYRIIERLGMGGMAVVYKAYDTRLERDVALKLIRTDSTTPEQHERMLKRFEREAKSQAAFSHPNIVPVFDYGSVDGSPFLVMAYVPGGTLKEKTGKPVDYRQALDWLLPISDALCYAHRRGLIHRDIKPSNILFDDEERILLTDFGIARILQKNQTVLTNPGMGIGTPEYMAPEQWEGISTQASDQYALGVVFFELLTGIKPYTADTPFAIANKQRNEPLPFPSKLVKGIPESVEKVLLKILAFNPKDRFESVAVLHIEFRNLLHKQGFSVAADPEKPKQKTDFGSSYLKIQNALSDIVEKQESLALASLDVSEDFQSLSSISAYPIAKSDLTPAQSHAKKITQMKQKEKRISSAAVGLIVFLAVIIGVFLVQYLINSESDPFSAIGAIVSTPNREDIMPDGEGEQVSAFQGSVVYEDQQGSAGVFAINANDGAVVVYIPEGEFVMGNAANGGSFDERLEHLVYLRSFWIHQTEVTIGQFRQCYYEGICNRMIGSQNGDEYPVASVTWIEANQYCEWAGGRLPTEAEWEKAAKGEDKRRYPWGDSEPTCDHANFADCSDQIMPAGSFPMGASPYGVLDMAGNVVEWVADWYGEDFYEKGAYDNPLGPDHGEYRVTRGGSWIGRAVNISTFRRGKGNPNNQNFDRGFRCVFDEMP